MAKRKTLTTPREAGRKPHHPDFTIAAIERMPNPLGTPQPTHYSKKAPANHLHVSSLPSSSASATKRAMQY